MTLARVLLTGGSGRLGRYLVKEYGQDVLAPSHAVLDVTDRKQVFAFIKTFNPDTVIHAAAWVDVRGCESDRKRAWLTNVEGTRNVVDAIGSANPECYCIYTSTACVFRGDEGGYTEVDVPYPVNFYGLTKLLGEQIVAGLRNHLIVRTDFVERAPWRYEKAFTDRYSTCVFSDILAKYIHKVVEMRVDGLIHLTGNRRVSHYDLARMTSPSVRKMTLADIEGGLPLPRDQSLKSVKGWANLSLI